MVDPVSLAVSVLSLAVASLTAWLTLFRRGAVKMTQPTTIFFGPNAPRPGKDHPSSKVYLRTLLFSTGKRGRIIESMHVTLSRIETHQNFNIWVYGEREKLVRGSGLYVGETGVAANHHFLTPEDSNSFRFVEGRYNLDVFAHLLGEHAPTKLFSQTLEITHELAAALREPHTGLYVDWGPDSSRYLSHVDKRLPAPDPAEFFAAMGITRD